MRFYIKHFQKIYILLLFVSHRINDNIDNKNAPKSHIKIIKAKKISLSKFFVFDTPKFCLIFVGRKIHTY